MMLDATDHVGYVVRSLDAGIAAFAEPFGLRVVSEASAPEYSIKVVYLTGGGITVELVEIADAELAEERLAGLSVRLDHVAYRVGDIDDAAMRLRRSGARFTAPDGTEIDCPLEFGGARHLMVRPANAPGVTVQLVQRRQ
ncbi:VOC family protein [Nocardia sp. SC052]|uniref:VOC family protein n=1 Tax=Nocardia sichangensis TaxID=3385975 RepID=UPI0039A11F3F